MIDTAISIENVVMQFGGLRAVDQVTLSIPKGQRHVLLGPNGAGKSTLFNMIGGQLRPSSGVIKIFGEDFTNLTPVERVKHGLGRTFQITSLFQDMTVSQNLQLAVRALSTSKFNMLKPTYSFKEFQENVAQLLKQWRFVDFANTMVKELSYGDQRKLEIAMCVANNPKIVLLDEPTSGLSVTETDSVVDLVKELPEDVTVVMVEHDMDVAFEVAERFTILHNGKLVMSGSADEVKGSEEIQAIYFGEEA